MTIFSAPGKAMWLGEYAVLSGGVAVCAAVDRFARVHRADVDADTFGQRLAVHSSFFGEAPAIIRDQDGRDVDVSSAPSHALLHAVVATLRQEGAPVTRNGAELTLDTSELSGAGKYGLGSSAALTVALIAALCSDSELGEERLTTLSLRAHHRFQGGVGSGSDVHAAARGGLLRIQRGLPVQRLAMPAALRSALIYTGVSADTREFVRAIQSWARDNAAATSRLEGLACISQQGTDALAVGDVPAWLAAVRGFHRAEVEITEASGVPIANAAVCGAVDIAERAGFAAKASGAGGGDIVVAFCDASGDMESLETGCLTAGYTLLDMQPVHRGAHRCGAH